MTACVCVRMHQSRLEKCTLSSLSALMLKHPPCFAIAQLPGVGHKQAVFKPMPFITVTQIIFYVKEQMFWSLTFCPI